MRLSKTLLLFIAALSFCGGLSWSGSRTQSAPSAYKLPLPQMPDLSTFDFRDAENRPVHSSEFVQQMRIRLLEGFRMQLLRSMTPARRRFMAMLNRAWDASTGLLKKAAEAAVRLCDSGLLMAKCRRTTFPQRVRFASPGLRSLLPEKIVGLASAVMLSSTVLRV
jgi:hypothetical protein